MPTSYTEYSLWSQTANTSSTTLIITMFRSAFSYYWPINPNDNSTSALWHSWGREYWSCSSIQSISTFCISVHLQFKLQWDSATKQLHSLNHKQALRTTCRAWTRQLDDKDDQLETSRKMFQSERTRCSKSWARNLWKVIDIKYSIHLFGLLISLQFPNV